MTDTLPETVGHGPDCGCLRCEGFAPGNVVAQRHGAYASPIRLDARAAEIADQVRPTLPLYSPTDEPVLRLFAITCVRIERASEALSGIDRHAASATGPYLIDEAEKLGRLRADLRGWIGTGRNLANDLGLTPTSRARLGVDLTRIEPSRIVRMQEASRS